MKGSNRRGERRRKTKEKLPDSQTWNVAVSLILLDLNVITIKKMLPDEKHDRTIGIKVREVLPDERLLELRTIKVRKLLPDEKHDQTFGIKFRQTKSMTGLLELMLPDEKHDRTIGIKVREGWVLPDEKHDRTFGIKDN
ncbi:hypothetical protein RclHR1_07210007 [Rhizophagus clarus]|uniref:Uncharacterized protein n=1 Tax=Rhizophagus clarus TaxID=94130 RepID=A0A2Z6RVA4_9GLOM|nr:hypothetical protein RclHR1_07210007 [Rhizophagus clarus]